MPGCVLHVTGENFDVNSFLIESDLRPYRVYHRGDIRRGSRIFLDGALSCNVSDADGNLDTEIADAICFLATHEAELWRLRNFPGVTNLRLDFGFYRRNVVAQFEYLPPELISRAGRLSIGIELSLYPNPIA